MNGASGHKASHAKGAVAAVCVGIVALVATLQLLGLLATAWWIADIVVHFQLQYAIATSMCCLGLLILKRYRWAAAAGTLLLLIVVRLAPWLLPAAPAQPDQTIRALLANLWTHNPEHGPMHSLMAREQPDLAALIEVDGSWYRTLASLPGYHVLAEPRDDNFGIALMSRLPVLHRSLLKLADGELPAARMTVTTPAGALHVLAVHPPPPEHQHWWRLRNRQLEAVALLIRSEPEPWLVLGDLNTTPWSPSFGHLVRGAGLVSSARGHGLAPTWPAQRPWPLRIPIDHCLHSATMRTVRHRLGPRIGSDHLPVIIDIALPSRSSR